MGGWMVRRLSGEEESAALRRAQRGDGAARNAVVEGRYGLARSIATRARRGRDCDDLTQDLAIMIFRAVEQFRDPGDGDCSGMWAAFLMWAMRGEVSRHLYYEKRDAKLWRRAVDAAKPEEVALDLSAPADPDAGHGAAALARALAGLGDEHREVVRLYYGLGGDPPLLFKEIAARLGISDTYAARLHTQALGKLWELLGGAGADGRGRGRGRGRAEVCPRLWLRFRMMQFKKFLSSIPSVPCSPSAERPLP